MDSLIEEKTNSEEFLLSVSVYLSDIVLIVVNDLTRYDQDLINKVTKMRMDSKKDFKEIFIIHNLRNLKTEQEYLKTLQELKGLYKNAQVLTQEMIFTKKYQRNRKSSN